MLALTSSCVLSVFPLLVTNIFNPLFRRVGCFCLSLERQRDKNRYRRTRGKTQRSEGWQGVRESAVRAKPLLVHVWRETGAVRNARPSRGQAASTRRSAKWENDGVAFRFRNAGWLLGIGCHRGGAFDVQIRHAMRLSPARL